MTQISLAKSLQPDYNSKAHYLPILKKSQPHKLLFIKGLAGGEKFGIVFNEDMKSQASLKHNGAINVNHNLKGVSHGNELHWSRRA